MSIFSNAIKQIDKGIRGENFAIPTGIPKLDSYIDGIYKGLYFLYGAETGIGKTKYIRYIHIDKVYEYYLQVNDNSKLDVHFIDFSLEMTPERNMLALISRKLYFDYGLEVTPKEMLSRKAVLSESIYNKIKGYKNDIETFEKKLNVYNTINPKKYHDKLLEFAKKNGIFEKNEETHLLRCGKYTPNNPNLLVTVLVDTINLAATSNIKKIIDKLSILSVQFRDICQFTIVFAQQFNSEISSTDRNRYGVVTPMLRDFEDSKRTTKDADLVFGLFSPIRHKMLTFNNYDISKYRNSFRSLHILKHRDGSPDIWIPLEFIGSVGIFKQMQDDMSMVRQE